jgi:N-acetyl-alpha-D-muramate 1-phosphate uridylyltransferase
MKCVIFAAGLGTRLRPLTDNMPKALVPVAGKPLLAHVLEKMAAAGFSDAVVNVHHFADQIIDYLATHDFGLRVAVSDERELLLETGGGLRHAQALLNADAPFLVHNVDILSNLDLAAFYKMHQSCDLATLLVSDRKTSRYLLFDEQLRLVGWTNVQTGEVRSPYQNLDVAACKKLAFAGIHTISTDIFPLMEGWPDRFSIIDFYLSVCATHTIRGVQMPNLRMLDVGKIDSLHEAENFLVDELTS